MKAGPGLTLDIQGIRGRKRILPFLPKILTSNVTLHFLSSAVFLR